MPIIAKQTAVRLLAHHPIYRFLPPGGLRTCGALLYHGERSPRSRMARLARTISARGGIPTRRLGPALAAARAAFRVGQDELVEPALETLARRFPDAPGPRVLRADLETFRGEYEAALASAEQARQVRPSSAQAAARVTRLGYRVWPRQQADTEAADAIGRFPRSSEVLWAVCKECRAPEQYTRLRDAWQERTRPEELRYGVRPLSLAAARAGLVDEAVALYQRAMAPGGAGGQFEQVTDTLLGGRGAWHAIEDLSQALDRAGVPYFFAAGTALGLIREGRPLSADSDIDVGIFDADWDREALIGLFRADPNFDLDLHPQTQKVGLRHRGGSPVDVFRYYREGGKLWHDGVFVRWHNTPFSAERREVSGRTVRLPDKPDEYLTENYGDWRTPNPAFDAFTDDAPNVEVTWPEYQRLHFYRRAYKRLADGDDAGAGAELRRAGIREAQDESGTREVE